MSLLIAACGEKPVEAPEEVARPVKIITFGAAGDTATLEYSGTILLVSHDREFLNNVVTSTIVFEADGEVIEYAGGYDEIALTIPVGADVVEVNLYYQTTSREYIEFLRDKNLSEITGTQSWYSSRLVSAREDLEAAETALQAFLDRQGLIQTAEGVDALQSQALQLRYLQTLTEIAGEKTNTIVFPLPMELFENLLKKP